MRLLRKRLASRSLGGKEVQGRDSTAARTYRRCSCCLVLVMAMTSAGQAVPAQVEKTVETTEASSQFISSGQVVVKGWDRPRVHVFCTLLSPNAELEVEQVPASGLAERVRLAITLAQPSTTRQQKTADLIVEVPLGASVEIHDPEGSVLINRLRVTPLWTQPAVVFPP